MINQILPEEKKVKDSHNSDFTFSSHLWILQGDFMFFPAEAMLSACHSSFALLQESYTPLQADAFFSNHASFSYLWGGNTSQVKNSTPWGCSVAKQGGWRDG